MKILLSIFVFQIFFVSNVFSQNILNFKFDNTMTDIIKKEGRPDFSSGNILDYDDKKIFGYDSRIVLTFADGKLQMAHYEIKNLSQNGRTDIKPPDAVLEAFEDISNKIMKINGPYNAKIKKSMPGYVKVIKEFQWTERNAFIILKINKQINNNYYDISIQTYSLFAASYFGFL